MWASVYPALFRAGGLGPCHRRCKLAKLRLNSAPFGPVHILRTALDLDPTHSDADSLPIKFSASPEKTSYKSHVSTAPNQPKRGIIEKRKFGHKKTALRTGRLIYNLAATYSHMAFRHTTIGATAFHFRVRNGAGWFRYAMATRILNSAGAESKFLRASMPY